MGFYYALKAGETPEVAQAIAEHYRPRGAGDRLPASDVGAVVGLADRIDTLAGCFSVGLQPTGSADPYGLRRAALGILQILLGREWSIDPLAFVGDTPQVREFLKVRLRGLLIESHGIAADCVDAALAIDSADVVRAKARAEAVALLRQRPDFEPLAVAFKRVANILKDQPVTVSVETTRFQHSAERELWDAYASAADDVAPMLTASDYGAAMLRLAELKEPVDRFFDAVMVMDEDPVVRTNRLALLGRINATFTRIADFRQLAV
jgi:glycyl-tRNA synthetase beta chain